MFRILLAITVLLLAVPAVADRDDRDDDYRSAKAERQAEREAQRAERRAERQRIKAERMAQRLERRKARDRRGAARAKTNICDPVKGATPSLYGLCVSYCEAPDISDVVQASPKRQAKAEKIAARKERVLARYNKRKTASDPDMPCVSQSVCPCWDNSYTSSGFWSAKTEANCLSTDQPTIRSAELVSGPMGTPDYASMQTFSASSDGVSFQHYCALTDTSQNISTFQEISETDAMVCAMQVQSTCGVVR